MKRFIIIVILLLGGLYVVNQVFAAPEHRPTSQGLAASSANNTTNKSDSRGRLHTEHCKYCQLDGKCFRQCARCSRQHRCGIRQHLTRRTRMLDVSCNAVDPIGLVDLKEYWYRGACSHIS